MEISIWLGVGEMLLAFIAGWIFRGVIDRRAAEILEKKQEKIDALVKKDKPVNIEELPEQNPPKQDFLDKINN